MFHVKHFLDNKKSVRQAPDAHYKYNTNLALYKLIARLHASLIFSRYTVFWVDFTNVTAIPEKIARTIYKNLAILLRAFKRNMSSHLFSLIYIE